MTAAEIEQVIDYVMFLSMRGETELALIEEAAISDEKDPNAFSDEIAREAADGVFNKWKLAADPGLQPADAPHAVELARASCAAANCSWARQPKSWNAPVATVHWPGRRAELREPGCLQRGGLRRQSQRDAGPARPARPRRSRTLWDQKPDDWGNPLRPANLNRGVYKGGRRPIDIYWRIAKGINGAQMPAPLSPPLNEQQDLGPGQLRAGTAVRARAAQGRARRRAEPSGGRRRGSNSGESRRYGSSHSSHAAADH